MYTGWVQQKDLLNRVKAASGVLHSIDYCISLMQLVNIFFTNNTATLFDQNLRLIDKKLYRITKHTSKISQKTSQSNKGLWEWSDFSHATHKTQEKQKTSHQEFYLDKKAFHVVSISPSTL